MISDIEGRLRTAASAQQNGRFQDAKKLYESVLADEPQNTEANLRLGILAVQSGQISLAIDRLQAVLEIDPAQFEALIWLAPILKNKGELDAAIDLSRVAATLRPEDPTGHSLLGLCQMAQGKPILAELSFQKAVSLDPNEPVLWHQLAECLELLARDEEAEAAYRHAIKLAPQERASYVGLAKLLISQGKQEEAAVYYRRAYKTEPSTPRGLSNLGKALITEGRMEEASKVFQQVIAANPKAGPPYYQLGTAQKYLGQFKDALASFERSMELQPRFVPAYFSYTYCRKMTSEDVPLAEKMRSMLSAKDLTLDHRRYLQYALGKIHNDLGEYGAAIAHFDEANRIMRQLTRTPIDRASHAAGFDVAIHLFPEAPHRPPEPDNERAVLIVGMIRSGTTLLEQIVSSHRDVAGGGELKFWLQHAKDTLDSVRGTVDIEGAIRAGKAYTELLRKIDPNAARVTDKMPLNYQYLGPISLACPGVRILHCRRMPLDNCLSVYLTPYSAPVPYAHDRSELVFYYRQYLRLMDHWRRVLPADRFLDVDYEDLILNREKATRRVLDFLGLEWDPACLHPEANRRTVETPSSWQVRQPVYRSSIERWRNYEPWLGELLELRD